MEKTLLFDLILVHMDMLQDANAVSTGQFLVDEREASEALLPVLGAATRETWWSTRAYIDGARVTKGDVVLLRGGGCAKVLGFLRADGTSFALVNRWQSHAPDTWATTSDAELVPLGSLGGACIWSVVDATGLLAHVLAPAGVDL